MHQHFRDLHRVRRRPLAEIVRDHPKIQPVRHCRVAADAADERLVLALGVQRRRDLALGVIVLICGFGASLFLAKKLSKPVDQIVATSVENVTRRKKAEKDLREVNRELEKTLNELKATQQQVIQQERLSALGR